MAGQFIVIEGPDGTGKTTLAKALVEELNKTSPTILVREPGGCEASELIRNVALHEKVMGANPNARMMLMFAARLQLCTEVITPALLRGTNVVCDRYFISTEVYQVRLEGASMTLFSELAYFVTRPDHVFLLRAPFEVCYARTLDRDQKGRNGYDDVSLGKKKAIWEHYNNMTPKDLEYGQRKTTASILDSAELSSAGLVKWITQAIGE